MYPNDLYLPLPSSVFLSGQLLHLDNFWHHHICMQIRHQLHCQIKRCWFLLRNPECRVCSYHCYPYQRGTNQRFSATVYSRKVKSENTQPLESLESLREKMALSAQDPNPGKWTLPSGIHRRVFRSPFLGRVLRNSELFQRFFQDSFHLCFLMFESYVQTISNSIVQWGGEDTEVPSHCVTPTPWIHLNSLLW